MVENEKYDVSGMTCASCASHVDKAVRKVEGVKEVSVNLLTNSMLVSYEEKANPEKIMKAVSDAGYQASLGDNKKTENKTSYDTERESLEDKETKKLIKRLIISLVFLIPLFYIAMGSMLDWNIGVLMDYPMILALIELVLSTVIIFVNKKFYISGFKALWHRSPNMDSLVAIGSGVAHVYSLALMFVMAYYVSSSGYQDSMSYHHVMEISMNLSFETAGMVPTLITVGKTLESYSKGKTTNAIKSLLDLAPKTAHVVRNGEEVTVPAEDVLLGETFLVKPGEAFPVDGLVLEGTSAVDESALTGESLPVDKSVNSLVSAATINQSGSLTCKATRVGNDTTLHQIIHMVETASGTKTKISAIADRVSGVFVPVVMIIAFLVFLFWMLLGADYVSSLEMEQSLLSYALERGISVLVISCPCALGLATPVAIMVGNGKGAKNGILFKTASALEECGKMDFVVLDKTGTITLGKPKVTDVLPGENVSEEELLLLAASLESKSEHPLSKAILALAKERNYDLKECLSFKSLPGFGLEGLLDNKKAIGGNKKLLEKEGILTPDLLEEADRLSSQGKTPLFFGYDDKYLGMIAVSDTLKEDSKEAITAFKELGVTPIMLTGDNRKTASAIAKQVEVSAFVSDVLPQGKQEVIEKLKKYGKVMMIGDGINDAPALTSADIGMAIGAGSDIAIDSADIVLMKSSLMDAVKAIRLSRETLKNIKENLFWAFFYNIIMIPVASGVFSGVGLNKMKPWMGAAMMSLSSVTVVLNALRLNLFNLDKKRSFHKKKKELPDFLLTHEETPIDDLLHESFLVEGMTCPMCVKHVKEAIESVEGVKEVHVSLEEKKADVVYQKSVDPLLMKKAVEEEGYVFNLPMKKVVPLTENNIGKEPKVMTKVLKVEGMMCKHCVMHVSKALEGIDGVSKVDVSLEKKEAVVELSKDIDDSTLVEAVKKAGYEATI